MLGRGHTEITAAIAVTLIALTSVTQQSSLHSIEALATQLTLVTPAGYNIGTGSGLNMDCLKFIPNPHAPSSLQGVFHSSKEQSGSGYNGLYYAESQDSTQWTSFDKLSSRGSQGYIHALPSLPNTPFLVLYELQNHEKGNAIAIRLYLSIDALRSNQFAYEYQLTHTVNGRRMVNVGTPSVEGVQLTKSATESRYAQFRLSIKFHYCPDGRHDYPGVGEVNMVPGRDFVDSEGRWVGGCKENYSDWRGVSDEAVETAIRRIGVRGKIGQRDLFVYGGEGRESRYYLYEVNLNEEFDWRNWRIVLYSEADGRAVEVPFEVGGVKDLANPHISQLGREQSGGYRMAVTFFIPSEAIPPSPVTAKAGEMIGHVLITP